MVAGARSRPKRAGDQAVSEVTAFIQLIAERHPELRQPVTYHEFLAIAERESIGVGIVSLARHARLVLMGHSVFIQLNQSLSRAARTVYGMHELCHFWRDDPGEPCYNAEDTALASPAENFAD